MTKEHDQSDSCWGLSRYTAMERRALISHDDCYGLLVVAYMDMVGGLDNHSLLTMQYKNSHRSRMNRFDIYSLLFMACPNIADHAWNMSLATSVESIWTSHGRGIHRVQSVESRQECLRSGSLWRGDKSTGKGVCGGIRYPHVKNSKSSIAAA
ncbi:hypothetical protein P152DRAFT_446045 [Eremomyces bilateralis CBS 781.70]|uniref:Uncharacterized protein n=1 Tax=Eremomyces bilateralis CBS 781.70 TaxID=1392243 RepID=A0A6G1GED2_9PEZI|nr:uncharacterized protein P152DRAFT_446045 [Eremomyces bilateralis CBS 781.70]KAF1816384.1 hypothetical protein P152DRAFT_446045 [Eremomyces bilateralis CBS 781.70]